jgi:hypothetical protein
MAILYYRYISDISERNQLVTERKILSMNATTGYETWYTPMRYDNLSIAQRELALPAAVMPIYRVGPVPENLIPPLTVGPRRVSPAFGHPGGGIEIATTDPVWLFGLWSFTNDAFDSSL